jgi:hypothetical protein
MAMATRSTTPNIYQENNVPSSKTPQPTRLTPQQLEERKAKGLCFNCDNKYSKGHQCGDKKLFYIDCEEEEEQEQEPSQDENVDAISSEELTPTISCNALAGISTPQTLKKWHPYLIGRHFKVKTDHDSLKYFLEQRLSSEEQQKWVTKILGYDFEIVYKKGKKNVVADALSRKDEDVEAFLYAILIIQPDWIIEARDEWKNDEKVWTLIQRLQQDSSASDTFTWKNDSLWYKDRLYLCKNSQLKQKVLLELHTSLVGGHSGFLKTYHRVKKEFFWDGLKTDVQRFVAECLVCQQNKVETIKTAGLLQPLAIPSQRWEEVSMDFIIGLPKSEGKSVIMVIVDRLTKYAHFCALSHPFKASTVATTFMEIVQKLHGSPKIIASDRDPIFT